MRPVSGWMLLVGRVMGLHNFLMDCLNEVHHMEILAAQCGQAIKGGAIMWRFIAGVGEAKIKASRRVGFVLKQILSVATSSIRAGAQCLAQSASSLVRSRFMNLPHVSATRFKHFPPLLRCDSISGLCRKDAIKKRALFLFVFFWCLSGAALAGVEYGDGYWSFLTDGEICNGSFFSDGEICTQDNVKVVDKAPLDNRIPLILIHGMTLSEFRASPSGASGWANFLKVIHDTPELNRKYKPYIFGYWSNKFPVDYIGGDLANLIEKWQGGHPEFKNKDVVIVAHSMGGLVARSYMDHDAGGKFSGDRVLKLITLATPHHGSPISNNQLPWGAMGRKVLSTAPILDVSAAIADWFSTFKHSYTDPNRSNLLWDNYDSVFNYLWLVNDAEINHWLGGLNSSPLWDSNIIAYSGIMAPNGGFWTAGSGGHGLEYNNGAGLISTIGLGASDGVVPLVSAQFDGHQISGRPTPFFDYDHTEMWQGKGYVNPSNDPLFVQLKQDLVQTYANLLPDSVTASARTLCNNGTGQIILTRSYSVRPATYHVSEGTSRLGDFLPQSLEYRFNSGTPNTVRSFTVTAATNSIWVKNSNLVTVNTPDCAAPADITPPSAPGLPQTSAWSRTNLFSIPLVLPNDPSNIARVFYKLGQPPVSSTDGLSLPLPQYNPLPVTLNQTSGTQTLFVWLEDGAGNRSYINRSSMTLKVDNTAPSITISNPTVTTTALNAIPLSGSFTDDLSGVASIKWFNDQGGSGEVPTGTPSLNANWSLAPITLYPGDNNLSVVAVDSAGNEGRANIKITKTDTTNSGSVMFTLSPSGAVTAGARWRANGGVWHLSGEYELNVPAGVAQIDFQGAGNYVAPQGYPVIVTAGQVTQRTESFPYSIVNVPPYSPSNPSPANGTGGLSRVNPTFSWTGGGPIGVVDYHFMLSSNSAPDTNPICEFGFGAVSGSSVTCVRTLNAGTTYYWKVAARDATGAITNSPVWSFTTEYAMPDLIVSNVVLNGNVAPGANMTANVTVQNIGNFASYGTSYVHVYLSSSPGGKNARLTPNVPNNVPVLQPGQTQTFNIPVTLTGLQTGTSYLDAWIDSTQFGQVEGNINNNLRSIPISYLDGQAPSISSAGLQNTFVKTGIANSIYYTATDDTGIRSVDFYYSVDGGVNWLPIQEGYVPTSPPAYGAIYPWSVPANLPITNNLKVRVVARDASGNAGEFIAGPYVVHDGTVPTVAVVSPNGGEVLPMGSTQQIKWNFSSVNPIAWTQILFAHDGTAEYIGGGNLTGDRGGAYSWTLPNNFSTTTGKLRVRVQDVNGNIAEDYSDGFFTVRDTSAPPPAPWTIPQALVTGASPQLATDSAGNLHEVYMVGQAIMYTKRTGASWSTPQIVYTGPSIVDLRLTVSNTGLPYLVWGTSYSGEITANNQSDIYFASFDGNNWSIPVNLSADLPGYVGVATVSTSPRIQVDSANTVHVAWTDGYYWNANFTITGQDGIYYRKKTLAGGWEPAINVSGMSAGYPDLNIDRNNKLNLTFWGFPSGSSAVLHSSNSGAGWTTPVVVAIGVDGLPRDLASDSNNHLHMVWSYNDTSISKREIFYSYYDGVAWSPKEKVSSTGSAIHPTINIDSLNRPHVTWEDWNYPSKLLYSFKNGSQWATPIQLHYDSQIVVNYSSTAALSALNNEMHVAWVSTVNGAGTILYNHANVGSTTDIFPPSVSVVAPVAGATLSVGSTFAIQWSANDNVGIANVDLHYSADNGVTWSLIAANQPNSGTYSWVVPAQASLQVRVTARDVAGNTGSGFSGTVTTSDTTPPIIALTAPTSGIPLVGNSIVNINWTAADNVAVTRIDSDYSLDGGVTWLTMASALSNSGTYAWLVPNSPTSALLIRVVAHDAAGYTTVASTTQPLTIVRANMPPLAPSRPFPLASGVNVSVHSPILNWAGGDPDGDALTYQVRFGTAANPPVISTAFNNAYAVGELQYSTQYYWQVVASDGIATSASPVWSFTTAVAPDMMSPNLNVTSPLNGSIVTSSPLTIVGTASDAGQGNSGIGSVTVNGLPANGGTATGSNIANWSALVNLYPGPNAIVVAATDGSPAANYASWNHTVIYNPPLISSSGDGLPDVWKTAHGISLIGNHANDDPDTDGYSNRLEYATGTDPNNVSSKPEGFNGLSYVQFRDRFDDGQYNDRWTLGSIAPFTQYSLTENGATLNSIIPQPTTGCTGFQLLSFAKMDATNTVYQSKLRMDGYGKTSVGFLNGSDPNNLIELIFDNDSTPTLQIRSVDAGVVTLLTAASPVVYRGTDVSVRLIKTGKNYAVFVNHKLQGLLINNGIGNVSLQPYMTMQSCLSNGGSLNTSFDTVEMLLDRDGDGLPDLYEDKNLNGIVDAGESDPLNPDTDGDGVKDGYDNCTLVANANQRDTDGDGYGNMCDADLNNSGGVVNFADQALFKAAFGTTNANADFDGNGIVNFADMVIFKSLFGKPPGPSGLVSP